jgi:GNAT superfamily N-acetyltransferase
MNPYFVAGKAELKMDYKILNNPTETELVTAVHENLYSLFRSMQILPGSEVVESDKIGYHHAFPTNPMFKGAWRTRLSAEEAEAMVDDTLAWFNERKAPAFYWWTDPQTQPTDLAERLLKRGFDGNLIGEPGMVADLEALNQDVRMPSGLTIRRVVDPKTLVDWRDVFTASYEMPKAEGQAWYDATVQAGLETAPWKMYVGYLGGKAVATSLLFNGAGVSGVYSVGTLPTERGKGIGTAITLKPLLDVRQQGYRYAVLFSSRIGYSVYQRLGFREVASKIGIYVLEED